MAIENLIVLGGTTKSKTAEPIRRLEIEKGEIIALAGPTGSGKSMLLADIEQTAARDTPSGRAVLIDGDQPDARNGNMIAQLSQTMNFVIDMAVGEFLTLHASSRGIDRDTVAGEVIELANSLAGEPINAQTNITTLSGGQSRALMIADVAIISDSPIVLIDEIENAGIDRLKALEMLSSRGKIIIIASHDPLIILMAGRRIMMRDGGMFRIIETDAEEKEMLYELIAWDRQISTLRESLRTGGVLKTTEAKEMVFQ
ncbi:ATP-binding cassette domain-containing protein [Dehalococcoidia bacterium]|nr:ATP-binding cassette domain-containing protein [Dehalococcoidia bacterium]MCL0088383.1 ATP-binding cassette domain-containing protein [Dehalococcoidia bacterium]